MKDSEVTTGNLSLCVRVFIESLLAAELLDGPAHNAGAEESTGFTEKHRKDKRPEPIDPT